MATTNKPMTISPDEYDDVLHDIHHELVMCAQEGLVDVDIHGDPNPYRPGSLEDRLASSVLGLLDIQIKGD